MGAKRANRGPDRAIAAIVARPHGVLSLTQLIDAGATRCSIERRVEAGRLHRLHRGVYAVGHQALSHRGRWLPAVLACGKGAALSHTDAAALWHLIPPARHPDPVHISVPGSGDRQVREEPQRVAVTLRALLRRYAGGDNRSARYLSETG
jgi:Transcriptional regulator, AbiEi antitoxin